MGKSFNLSLPLLRHLCTLYFFFNWHVCFYNEESLRIINELPSEHIAYRIVPSAMLSGIKPNALMYMI